MTITIEFGWWVIPAVITAIAFLLAHIVGRSDGPDTFGAGAFISLMFHALAACVSLVAWLIWSLAT